MTISQPSPSEQCKKAPTFGSTRVVKDTLAVKLATEMANRVFESSRGNGPTCSKWHLGVQHDDLAAAQGLLRLTNGEGWASVKAT